MFIFNVVFQTEAAAEITDLSFVSVDDSCYTKNAGYAVPCMSTSDVKQCIDVLTSSQGPLLFINGNVIRQPRAEFRNWNKLQLTQEPICWIKLRHQNKTVMKSCYGVYWGNGYILTAGHTFENASFFDVYVFFPTKGFTLVYEASLPKEHHMFNDRDQCLVHVLGDTTALGSGVCEHIGQLHMNEELYFYTIRGKGNFHMHECKHIDQSSGMTNMFLMSKAGQPGESGNPIYSSISNKCVGIYRGIINSYGLASEIEYKQIMKCTASSREDVFCLSRFSSFISFFICRMDVTKDC
ncbi:hypothetical protein [Aeromonas sobria]|uniref:hypothetical protein n=1 Tax=Aeromonas sobria TaxID=646 RepID=UPI003F3C63D3